MGSFRALAASAALLAAIPGSVFAADTYRQSIEAFRAERETGLRQEGSWLTLIALHWLAPGDTAFGSGANSALRLPASAAPAAAGRFTLANGVVRAFLAAEAHATVDGRAVSETEMVPDSSGAPTILKLGSVTMQVIERGGKLAVRVKDDASATRTAFKGLHWFPVEERYRIVARFVPLEPHGTIKIANITGQVNDMESPGFAEFEWQGRTFRLQPVYEAAGDQQLFYIFKDTTAGKQTYGAGRFLYSDLPKDGTVVLDFNKAYSPPCAFTNFATCPLPPRQNRLPFAVAAGELNPHPHPSERTP
jgi:uncharacterized protein (DUF1684 family)